MIVEEQYRISLKDIEKNCYLKNIGILEILENAGAHHSDIAGYGINDIKRTGLAWILLDWKLKIIKRPKYGELLKTNTWGRKTQKIRRTYTYRDFEIYNEKGELCVIATSKWAIMNINSGKISKITDEILKDYKLEEKNVFDIEELNKIKIPEEYLKEINYNVCKRDIDLNGHVHNLNYLYWAYEILPEKVYDKRPFNNVRIQYKKEIKYGENVKCKYSFQDNKNYVTIYNEDETVVHAVVILY